MRTIDRILDLAERAVVAWEKRVEYELGNVPDARAYWRETANYYRTLEERTRMVSTIIEVEMAEVRRWMHAVDKKLAVLLPSEGEVKP